MYKCVDCSFRIEEPTTPPDKYGTILCDACGGDMRYLPSIDTIEEREYMQYDDAKNDNIFPKEVWFLFTNL